MADAGAPAGERSGLVASYEALREAVLGGRPEGWRLGHGVLANRGVAAWMATWATVVVARGAGTAVLDPSASTPSPLPTTIHPLADSLPSLPDAAQVVAVIADMALAHI